MAQIIGEIDGKRKASDRTTDVTEHSPVHFSVFSDGKTQEVFLTSNGALSDGNSIDSVEVVLESPKEAILRERFATSKAGDKLKSSTKGMNLKAAMPGMVKAVTVSIGDAVQKNTQVMVLEAMKMENSITAGFIGIVEKIHIEPGVSVEKNALLMEFRVA